MSQNQLNDQERNLQHQERSSHGRYIKSIVFGGLDGVVTTFVVVAGATGASLSTGVLLILGLGSLVGDAFSMGVGDYAGSKSEEEYHESEKRHHEWVYQNNPEREREKIKEAYLEKGLDQADAQTVADIITKKQKTAVEVMMLNEHGIVEHTNSPVMKGVYTFSSFLFFGSIPLLTYLVEPFIAIVHDNTFVTACTLTCITLFSLGALKVRITEGNWFISGLQMMATGSASALVAYIIGHLLAGLA